MRPAWAPLTHIPGTNKTTIALPLALRPWAGGQSGHPPTAPRTCPCRRHRRLLRRQHAQLARGSNPGQLCALIWATGQASRHGGVATSIASKPSQQDRPEHQMARANSLSKRSQKCTIRLTGVRSTHKEALGASGCPRWALFASQQAATRFLACCLSSGNDQKTRSGMTTVDNDTCARLSKAG